MRMQPRPRLKAQQHNKRRPISLRRLKPIIQRIIVTNEWTGCNVCNKKKKCKEFFLVFIKNLIILLKYTEATLCIVKKDCRKKDRDRQNEWENTMIKKIERIGSTIFFSEDALFQKYYSDYIQFYTLSSASAAAFRFSASSASWAYR